MELVTANGLALSESLLKTRNYPQAPALSHLTDFFIGIPVISGY
jgi:hypothetical protein